MKNQRLVIILFFVILESISALASYLYFDKVNIYIKIA